MNDDDDDDDRDRIAPANEVFSLGPEPVWLVCTCGAQCARVPCFECTVAADGRAERAALRIEGDGTIPFEFRWANLKAPELETRVDARRKTLSDMVTRILASHRVVLAGGSGAGKTSLAIACLRRKLEHGGRFVSAIDLATARIQHSAGDGEAAIVERSIFAKLLLIDDLGEEQHTSTSAVRDVIRARHAAGRATWVTTGLRSKDILAKYGDGIRRRLFDGAYAEWLGPVPDEKKAR